MKTKIIYLLCLLTGIQFTYAQDQKQSAGILTVKCPDQLFIGAIMEPESINEDVYRILDVPFNPITITFSSLNAKSQTITPSYKNMMNTVRQALQNNGPLKQSDAFSYTIRELNSYNELALFFGQNINRQAFFGIPANQKPKKTTVIVDINQIFFTVMMDLPESLSNDPKVLEQQDKLVYANSIRFGRRAIILIESNFDYQTIAPAIKEMLKTDGKAAKASEKSIALLANSTIRLMSLSGEEIGSADPDAPFDSLINYMGKEVTDKDFGYPVSFSASRLKDNSVFENEYSLE